jgi:hypothetical protein
MPALLESRGCCLARPAKPPTLMSDLRDAVRHFPLPEPERERWTEAHCPPCRGSSEPFCRLPSRLTVRTSARSSNAPRSCFAARSVCPHLAVGSAYMRFRRALDRENVTEALSAASELGFVGLAEALELTPPC